MYFGLYLIRVYAQSIKGNQDGQREVSYIITDNDPLFCSGTRFLIIADKNGFNIICQNPTAVALTAREGQTIILGNIFHVEHDALKFIAENWDKINK